MNTMSSVQQRRRTSTRRVAIAFEPRFAVDHQALFRRHESTSLRIRWLSVWTGFDGRRPPSPDNDRLAETGPRRHRHADGRKRLAAETAELELRSERDRHTNVGPDRHDLVLQRVAPPHLSLSADEQPYLLDRAMAHGHGGLSRAERRNGRGHRRTPTAARASDPSGATASARREMVIVPNFEGARSPAGSPRCIQSRPHRSTNASSGSPVRAKKVVIRVSTSWSAHSTISPWSVPTSGRLRRRTIAHRTAFQSTCAWTLGSPDGVSDRLVAGGSSASSVSSGSVLCVRPVLLECTETSVDVYRGFLATLHAEDDVGELLEIRPMNSSCRADGWNRSRGIVASMSPPRPAQTFERATGIEPAFSAWEADVLPLNYAREQRGGYQAGPRPARERPRAVA